jgi:catechol 2,3-dioxygenase-like lactoylglutathione lyase family enzyme
MAVIGMNHFTVLARDLQETKSFYVDLLGLVEGERPDLGFPGAWLCAGGAAVLHIVAGRALPADPRGVIDHMAFTARDLAGTVKQLQARNLRYDLRRLSGSGIWQLFCFDPNGARVELDFDPAELAP